jgi:hypothetical protein
MAKVYDLESERFVRKGSLPGDEEKETSILKYAYHLAQANNHLPRAYHIGIILRYRLITEIGERSKRKGFWSGLKSKRLKSKLNRLEDELYVINHLVPGHFVPFEKYDFMQKRENEGDKILEETVKEYLE